MNTKLFIFTLIGLFSSNKIDNQPVAIELNKYLGKWYEIARFDHSFERGMQNVTAEYILEPDGNIKVINQGYRDGKFKESEGKARRPDPSRPGELEVAFFLNFYAGYYILELAPDYSYVLVGSDSDDYLWIMSRTPKMKNEDLEFLLERARQRGYDTSKLIMVEQK